MSGMQQQKLICNKPGVYEIVTTLIFKTFRFSLDPFE